MGVSFFFMCKYHFRRAKFKDDFYNGFWVTVYYFIECDSFSSPVPKVHVFFNQQDWLENRCFASELGIKTDGFTKDILVTPLSFPLIYKEISDYVSQSASN